MGVQSVRSQTVDMKLLDSNIFTYAASGAHDYLHTLLEDEQNGCSVVACIEVLGFPRLKNDEKAFYESAFETLHVIPLSEEVKNKAIEIKQKMKISLGDSIMAATALCWNGTLYTRNVDDFKNIDGLSVINPIN
jgi:toxin FitB